LWVGDIQVDIVGIDVAVTSIGAGADLPSGPQNLELVQ
jgi:hypothetical protein